MRLNTRIIMHLMGLLLLCNGGFMLLAALVSGIYGDGATYHISLAALATLFTGTAAMFLVGGGILVHGIPPVHHWIENLEQSIATWPHVGRLLTPLAPILMNAAVGIAAGAIVLFLLSTAQGILRRR